MVKWTKIYASSLQHEAEIVKMVLVGEGVFATIINKQDTSYHFGEYEVYINDVDAEIATQIINDNVNFS